MAAGTRETADVKTFQEEADELRAAVRDLGRAFDKALGLTRFVAWLNARLVR